MNTNFITKAAVNNARHKNTREEYWLGIIITGLVRFLSAGVSIYAGYFYFENLLTPISNGNKLLPVILAILLLATVEFFSAWLISKMSKSLLEKRYQRTAILFVFAAFTFTASFVSSTNGLAMRQSEKADNTTVILENTDIEQKNIQERYKTLISELQTEITDIKANPQGWKGGRRVFLTAKQLERIAAINERIQSLRDDEKAEIAAAKSLEKSRISDNRAEMTATSDKYYTFIAIVMLISLISNVAMQAFYMRILHEEAEILAAQGRAEMDTENLKELTRAALENTMIKEREKYGNSLIIAQSGMKHISSAPTQPKEQRQVGFKKESYEETEETNEHPGGSIPFAVVREPSFIMKETPRSQTAVCEHCGQTFTKKTTWQKFCSEDCRKTNYENKTGKHIYLKTKK